MQLTLHSTAADRGYSSFCLSRHDLSDYRQRYPVRQRSEVFVGFFQHLSDLYVLRAMRLSLAAAYALAREAGVLLHADIARGDPFLHAQ